MNPSMSLHPMSSHPLSSQKKTLDLAAAMSSAWRMMEEPHYNSMPQQVSPELWMDWAIESILLDGNAGFSFALDRQKCLDMFALNVDNLYAQGRKRLNLDEEVTIDMALGQSISNEVRQRWVHRMLNFYAHYKVQSLKLIDAELNRKGLTQERIARMSTTTKVRFLADRRLGIYSSAPQIHLQLCTPIGGDSAQSIMLAFRRDIRFDDLIAELYQAVSEIATPEGLGDFKVGDHIETWKYRLLDKHNSFAFRSQHQDLGDERAFRVLLSHLQREETPRAMVFHVSRILHCSEHKYNRNGLLTVNQSHHYGIHLEQLKVLGDAAKPNMFSKQWKNRSQADVFTPCNAPLESTRLSLVDDHDDDPFKNMGWSTIDWSWVEEGDFLADEARRTAIWNELHQDKSTLKNLP